MGRFSLAQLFGIVTAGAILAWLIRGIVAFPSPYSGYCTFALLLLFIGATLIGWKKYTRR